MDTTKKKDELEELGAVGTKVNGSPDTSNQQTQRQVPAEPQQGAGTGYQPSDAVTKAWDSLNQHLAQQPGAYQSQWQKQLDDTIQKILNREPFQYDMNADVLYQQYKDQYINGGRLAMIDTMGQAQAMTGGYGNSYAQGVGQQAYQGYLQGLNDQIPELYQLALSRYQQEGDALTQQYALMQDREKGDFERYLQQLSAWQQERDYLAGRHDAERDWDYRQEMADADRDQQAWENALRLYNAGIITPEIEEILGIPKKEETPGVGASGGGHTGYDNQGYDTATIQAVQSFLGVTADGKWGPRSQAAAEKYGGLAGAIKAMNGQGGGNSTYDPVEAAGNAANAAGNAFATVMNPEFMSRQQWEASSDKVDGSYEEYLRNFAAYLAAMKGESKSTGGGGGR